MDRKTLTEPINLERLQQRAELEDFSPDIIGFSEDGYYSFTQDEVETLYAAAREVLSCFKETTADFLQSGKQFTRSGFDPRWREYFLWSWESEHPELCGRLDFSFDPSEPPKLLEYNADTPALLAESGPLQKAWKSSYHPISSQANNLDSAIVDRWTEVIPDDQDLIHFTSLSGLAYDHLNVFCLKRLAEEAGKTCNYFSLEEIIWDPGSKQFLAPDETPIQTLFKFYPWEWLLSDQFSTHLLEKTQLQLIEPAWKGLYSSKAMLVVLAERFPDHPNILPASFSQTEFGDSFVAKPVFGRQGENITLSYKGKTLIAPGTYDECPMIYQKLAPLPLHGGRYPCISVWMVGGEPAGLSIRDSGAPLTTSRSEFVPHVIEE